MQLTAARRARPRQGRPPRLPRRELMCFQAAPRMRALTSSTNCTARSSFVRSRSYSMQTTYFLVRSFPWFDRAAGFPSPRPACRRRRAQGVSRLAAAAATVRLGLDTPEHDGTLVGSGLVEASPRPTRRMTLEGSALPHSRRGSRAPRHRAGRASQKPSFAGLERHRDARAILRPLLSASARHRSRSLSRTA